jgi:hypothetical protein
MLERSKRWLSVGLAGSLVLGGALPVEGGQAEQAPKLQIVILEGEGAINNIRQRTAREPIVQVEDENHKPVAGAVVLFALPSQGPSGVFANGQTSMTVMTNAQGRAVATGLKPNGVQGNLQIRVNASYQGRTASATISQTNALAAAAAAGAGGGISAKVIVLLLVIAGGAAGGAIAATRSSNKPTPTTTPAGPQTTTVTAGTPTVSAPAR